MDFFATSPYGLQELLADELTALGIGEAVSGAGGARFSGTLEDGYRACLWSRVANRLLLVLAEDEEITSDDALYAWVRKSVKWHDHIDSSSTLAVTFHTRRSQIDHSEYGAQKTKDAIVDQIREATGARPSVKKREPDVRVHVRLVDDRALLAIDLSGEPLHRRGVRVQSTEAPLKENVAAAILLRMGWPEAAAGGTPLFDPMCGSGTFLIEAGWMATRTPPGLHRTYWGHTRWKGADSATWERLVGEARSQIQPLEVSIRGADHSGRAVAAARTNVAAAGLEVAVAKADFFRDDPGGEPGFVVFNPPYGKRLQDPDATDIERHQAIDKRLKSAYAGWTAFVLTDERLAPHVGLRATRTHTFFNGPIRCTLLHLPIHESGQLGVQPDSELVNRIRKRAKHLARWARREQTDSYRVYDRDVSQYPAYVDVYANYAVVQELQAPKTVNAGQAARRSRVLTASVAAALDLDNSHVIYKLRRRQRGAKQYERQSERGVELEVQEGGLAFHVNLTDYIDTGLFLDHRRMRARLRDEAEGKTFLNLYAYTGTATVYAAAGGASRTTTVDLSKTYLDWAKRNLDLNNLGGKTHRFVRADCMQFLREDQGTYDLMFIDPPTFSTSKRTEQTFDIERDHVELIELALARLAAGGTLYFSSNAKGFALSVDAFSGVQIEDITPQTVSKDFERRPRAHVCYQIVKS